MFEEPETVAIYGLTSAIGLTGLNYFTPFHIILTSFFHCIYAFIQSILVSTCKNYAYCCKIFTFRAFLKVGLALHSPLLFLQSRN